MSVHFRITRTSDPGVTPLAQDLQQDQARILSLANIVATGVEPGHSIFGLIRVDARSLSPEGRVETLQTLVGHYETAHLRIVEQRAVWGQGVSHLGPRLTEAVAPRVERLRQLERKRILLEITARGQSDTELVERTHALGARLEAALKSLAGVVVAFMRRADAIRVVLADWDRHAQEQEGLLGQLRDRVEARARVLELEREVREFEEGPKAQSPALSGDGPFDDLFKPLDLGLEAARDADDRLQRLVRGLLELASGLQEEGGDVRVEPAEERAGEALLQGPFDDVALLALALSDTDPKPSKGAPEPLDQRLRKIETALDRGCLSAFGEDAFLRRASGFADPYLWREYLVRYPNGSGVTEARSALVLLDRAALSRAEQSASRHGWWSYLRDFADGMGAAKAREALAGFESVPTPTEVLKRLATPTESGVFLGEISPLECQVGWGALRVNEGGDVQVLGERCERFIAPHPPSRVVYAVPDGVVRFSAIGTRFSAPEAAHGTWRYEVRLDDRQVFLSKALHDEADGIPIEISLPAGTKRLEIRIDDYGDSHYDWAVLAQPLFHRT